MKRLRPIIIIFSFFCVFACVIFEEETSNWTQSYRKARPRLGEEKKISRRRLLIWCKLFLPLRGQTEAGEGGGGSVVQSLNSPFLRLEPTQVFFAHPGSTPMHHKARGRERSGTGVCLILRLCIDM